MKLTDPRPVICLDGECYVTLWSAPCCCTRVSTERRAKRPVNQALLDPGFLMRAGVSFVI
jgi:hypothetical protein